MQIQRPRSVREVFELSLMLYRRRFRFLIGTALAVLFPYYVASTYVKTHFMITSVDQVQSLMSDMEAKGNSVNALFSVVPARMYIWYLVLTAIFFLLVLPIAYGMIAHMSSRVLVRGKDMPVAEAGNVSFRRLFPNMGTLALALVTYVVLGTCYMFLLSLVASVAGALSVVIAILGTLAFIVGIVVYFIRFSFVPAIVVEEGTSFFRAMGRSWSLTKSNTGQLLGFYVMLLIVCFIAQTFMTLIGDVLFYTPGAELLVSAVVGMLIMPFAFTCMSVMYLELRSRRTE
ncbi:hypothetical protein NZD89_07545 [Alicyclobacillus fastidiosus]|uniref:Glycerophosphoryl diester phosphodiesterase membrane domain-containing protein n=1 Tax=Alicyclobacillus fastidiosus TaxID=392011 RepID=A0ABY6ZKB0_9BACL|nr:hypothetical protein [Alicyclobacillus fastidiosus]WAH43240.1 hypothetical protein NZD89_07545 [Alicyclobacillus fastidiosus]GMA65279.1 hypothetical protein GCM10025859_57190 [Alicyclobacillus fastidiosus]